MQSMFRTTQKSVLSANIINHIGLILDASGSMRGHKSKLIEVADSHIQHLANRSKELDQETRISVWTFSDAHDIQCVVWDKDVLRLPSIAQYYQIAGQTAFLDAAMKAFQDMGTTSQIYGDHSFLYYFLTDGYENASIRYSREDLKQAIKGQADNVTLAALVPGPSEVMQVKNLGFPAGNVQIWNTMSATGMEDAGRSIISSTDAYMTARASGLRSTSNLFDMSVAAVNKQTIQAAGLTPLDPSEYVLVPVIFPVPFQEGDDRIDTFTQRMGFQFIVGRGFYQLTLKPVQVQAQKEIAVVEKKSGKVYTGRNARALLGLPDMTVTLKASQNPDYDIFIQSTSLNRKLLLGSKYLYLTPNATYTRGQQQSAPVHKAVPHVAKMPPAPKKVSVPAPRGSKKAPIDLTAPIYPKGGKATWAGRGCSICHALVNQRCKRSDGSPMEKPHPAR